MNFPRSPRVRKRWLLRRVFELAAFSGLLLFIANQYLEPAVSNAMKPLSQSDWWRVLERVLKLALPNLYAWLVRPRGGGLVVVVLRMAMFSIGYEASPSPTVDWRLHVDSTAKGALFWWLLVRQKVSSDESCTGVLSHLRGHASGCSCL